MNPGNLTLNNPTPAQPWDDALAQQRAADDEPLIHYRNVLVPGGIPHGGYDLSGIADATDAPWGGFDFIPAYTAWADVVELPREVHTTVAIQMIAAILNNNGVTIEHSNFNYSMDLWQLVLTHPVVDGQRCFAG